MARDPSSDSLRRKKHTREPKKLFMIFCEGANTERRYFDALRRSCGQALIEVRTNGPSGDAFPCAEAAVKKAKKKKSNSWQDGDEVWAVFDRDQAERFNEAIALCEKHGIGIGRSNPCFEVWLILHLEEFDRACDPKAAQKYLEKIHPPMTQHGIRPQTVPLWSHPSWKRNGEPIRY